MSSDGSDVDEDVDVDDDDDDDGASNVSPIADNIV